jgi:gliding motility-associated-like protein
MALLQAYYSAFCSVKIYFLLFLQFCAIALFGQCDLELLEFDPIGGTISVAFNSTESCGGAAGPTGIAEIQFGFQAVDDSCNAMNQGWDFPWGLSIPDDNNHPGWIYSATTTLSETNWTNFDVWAEYDVDPPYYTGDTITFPLDDFYQTNGTGLFSNLLNAFDFWLSQDLSIQAVIWQISYGPTIYADEGGWAEVGGLGGGITPPCCGLYEDSNWQDNWLVVGPCGEPLPELIIDTIYIELPADTIFIEQLDTVFVYDTTYITEYDTTYITEYDTTYITEYDTTYITLPPDTIVQLEYDTTFIEMPPDTITIIDTLPVPINWYFYDTTYITLIDTLYVPVDCLTGMPCNEELLVDCPVYIPNALTPNNNGVNDAWRVYADPSCFTDVSIRIFTRSGELVEEFDHLSHVWDGSVDRSFAQDGVYVYWVRMRFTGSAQVYEKVGHITLLR